jgi:hypothetical protein
MHRRDISKALFATAAASTAVARQTEAQTSTAHWYPRTAVESAAGVTPTNYAYMPGNVLRYGADPTGAANSTTAFTNAVATNSTAIVPAGTYLLSTTPINRSSVVWQIANGAAFKGAGGAGFIPNVTFQDQESAEPAGGATFKIGTCAGNELQWTANPMSPGWVTSYCYMSSSSGRSGAPNKGIWSFNPLTDVIAGHDVTAWVMEVDINNNASNVSDPDSAYHKVGIDTVSGGANPSTCAYRVGASTSNGSNWWYVGSMCERVLNTGYWCRTQPTDSVLSFTNASFWDESNSHTSLLINYGTHQYGIDMLGARFSSNVAIRLPYPAAVAARNIANTADLHLIELGTGNSVVIGNGNPSGIIVGSELLPIADNRHSCGTGAARWTAVWAVNGTIQTSDPRLKTDIAPLPPALPLIEKINPATFRWQVGGFDIQEIEELQEVHAHEDVQEECEEVEVQNGKATLVKKTRIKRVPLYDLVPVVDTQGNPVMHTKVAKVTDPVTGKNTLTEQVLPRVHHAPRMVRQMAEVKKQIPRPGKRVHWGFLAPDVKAAFDSIGMDFGGYVKDGDGTEHLRPDQLIPVLWKAVQELSARVVALEATKAPRAMSDSLDDALSQTFPV